MKTTILYFIQFLTPIFQYFVYSIKLGHTHIYDQINVQNILILNHLEGVLQNNVNSQSHSKSDG